MLQLAGNTVPGRKCLSDIIIENKRYSNEKSALQFNCKTVCKLKKIVNLSSEVEIKLLLSEKHIIENEFSFFIRTTYLQVIRIL